MRILFVLDQLPYPARNGVTIPTYNLLTGLSRNHRIDLLLIDRELPDNLEYLAQNERLVDRLWVTKAPESSRFDRILNELSGRSMFHMGRQFDIGDLRSKLYGREYDVVWVSDDGILDVVVNLRAVLGSGPLFIAGINDAITGVFRGAARNVLLPGLSLRSRVLLVLKWLRSWRIADIERSLLNQYDIVPVQSDADAYTLSRISGGSLDTKVVVLTNGVESGLYDIELVESEHTRCLFVGSLIGYGPIVKWLLAKVWPDVVKQYPDATLTIVGKGASEGLIDMMEAMASVEYVPFVEDIREVYEGYTLAILPVRKSWGLINKVVESMAAGVPVVGDAGSFNAIPGFIDGEHGVVCGGYENMIDSIKTMLGDDDRRLRISESARKLVEKQFSWDTRIARIERAIAENSKVL